MLDKIKQHKDTALIWLRANIVTVIVSIVLLVLAGISLSYGFLNQDNSQDASDVVGEINSPDYQRQSEVDQLSNTENSDDQAVIQNQNTPSQETEGQANEKPEVDHCPEVDRQARVPIEKMQEKSPASRSLEQVTAYNDAMKHAYEKYHGALVNNGCKPVLMLEELLQEVGVNLTFNQ